MKAFMKNEVFYLAKCSNTARKVSLPELIRYGKVWYICDNKME